MPTSTTLTHAPLGQRVSYPDTYDPTLLFPIARLDARQALGVGASLPFIGADVWNAYELSWLDARGKPQVVLARFEIAADSPRIIESKSFKLYLNSYSQTQLPDARTLHARLVTDLSQAAGAQVGVTLIPADAFAAQPLGELAGVCLDAQDIAIDTYTPAPELLTADAGRGEVEETLMSRLLRSNCPVTGQPDWGCVQIAYRGAPIDHAGLLRFIVSLRRHTGFHEDCVERLFCELMQRCQPRALRVYARYTRRGGLDINPWRATQRSPPPALWRDLRQ